MKRWMAVLILAGLLLALRVPAVQAVVGYDLSWWTVAGGGVTNPGQSGLSLSGTIGQPAAAAAQNSGYTLSSGFWYPVEANIIFVPVARK